jgi:hypothetical protein
MRNPVEKVRPHQKEAIPTRASKFATLPDEGATVRSDESSNAAQKVSKEAPASSNPKKSSGIDSQPGVSPSQPQQEKLSSIKPKGKMTFGKLSDLLEGKTTVEIALLTKPEASKKKQPVQTKKTSRTEVDQVMADINAGRRDVDYDNDEEERVLLKAPKPLKSKSKPIQPTYESAESGSEGAGDNEGNKGEIGSHLDKEQTKSGEPTQPVPTIEDLLPSERLTQPTNGGRSALESKEQPEPQVPSVTSVGTSMGLIAANTLRNRKKRAQKSKRAAAYKAAHPSGTTEPDSTVTNDQGHSDHSHEKTSAATISPKGSGAAGKSNGEEGKTSNRDESPARSLGSRRSEESHKTDESVRTQLTDV